MVGSSKILTVSYGTFSCTLEGFDDPFVTMKSIAEYFRDLAADDRFFGAEPPQPDVQHLHSLAQKNTPVRVEAEVEENGLRLRQEGPAVSAPLDTSIGGEADPSATVQTAAEPLQDIVVPTAAQKQPEPVVVADVIDASPEPSAPKAADAAKPAKADEFHSLVEGLDDDHGSEDEGENLFEDISGDEITAVAGKLARARSAVDAETKAAEAKPEEKAEPKAERSDQRRRGIALSLTDDDLTDATALPARPRQRPEAFTETAADYQPKPESSLSEEAEAELMAELAALEAEEAPESAPVDAKTDDALKAQASKAGRAILEGDMIEREDAAIDRLMATTNSKLSDDSVQQKRNQLSHLKAAVAATMADRAVDTSTESSAEPDKAYRKDLAKVVRPSAADATANGAASEKNGSANRIKVSRPNKDQDEQKSPLVLVSGDGASEDSAPKQTADAGQRPVVRPSRPARPEGQAVAPRRINRKDPNKISESSENKAKFSEYASKVGAQELSDLLEAAGAYLNKVEGKAVFTRPQIMQMVLRQDEGKRFTREDSLRGFDNLVRKGAIQRVDRGQFAIASESRFVN